MDQSKHPLVLFDGYCNLCNRLVYWIIKLDRKKHLKFASLQNYPAVFPPGGLNHHGIDPDTLIYIEDDRAYYKSDAILKISRKLGGLLLILQIGYVMPVKWRNRLYDFIARNRYRWFGKRHDCMVPDRDYSDRFFG